MSLFYQSRPIIFRLLGDIKSFQNEVIADIRFIQVESYMLGSVSLTHNPGSSHAFLFYTVFIQNPEENPKLVFGLRIQNCVELSGL